MVPHYVHKVTRQQDAEFCQSNHPTTAIGGCVTNLVLLISRNILYLWETQKLNVRGIFV